MTTMNKIDDFITDILADEALLPEGSMGKEQQARIEDKILKSISAVDQSVRKRTGKLKNDNSKNGKRRLLKRKTFVLFLAAALASAFGITAGAAVSHEWDIALVNFMGISNADTMQLEDGVVEIGSRDISEGIDYAQSDEGELNNVMVTATTSIGDKNTAYIRLDTNYEVPEDYDEEKDYILPEHQSLHVYSRKPEKSAGETTGGSVTTCVVEDGRLSFLIYLNDYKNLNKSYVSVSLENFMIYHDKGLSENDEAAENEPELLYTGTWELNWKYSYRSNVKTYHIFKKLEQGDVTYYLTKIEVSPMAVRMEGIKNPLDRKKTLQKMDLEEIVFKDGRSIELEETNIFGCRYGIWMEGACDMQTIGEALEPDAIESIVVEGKKILLR